jgi:hypothetical protein
MSTRALMCVAELSAGFFFKDKDIKVAATLPEVNDDKALKESLGCNCHRHIVLVRLHSTNIIEMLNCSTVQCHGLRATDPHHPQS